MFFKSKPIGVNAFFCNTHGSLNPLSLGPVFTDVPPVKGSHVGLGQSLGHQVLQVSLVVSSHFDIQATYSNLIQNWSNWFDITFTIPSDDYHSHHSSVDHQNNKNPPILSSNKSKVCRHWGKCRTLIISSFMMTSPGRSPPTSLYTRVATFVVRPVATSFVLPQKAPQQLGFFKVFWKIWFRFLRNDFFPFS